MSIKSHGGIFGRNPTFNEVKVEGDLSIDGQLTIAGEVITGLSYQGGWNADTNNPDIAGSFPVTGQFWIVTVDGSTDVGGITNWTVGDWALYDGTNWQRVEGGNTDLDTGVSGTLKVLNGGTGANDAAGARTNLGLGTAATTDSTAYATAAQGTLADSSLQPGDIGSTVQGYDADTAKYDDVTANFTGTLQNGGSNVVVDSDIGSTVQGYDADTAKYDDATANFTGTLQNNGSNVVKENQSSVNFQASANATLSLKSTNGSATTGTVLGKVDFIGSDGSSPGGGIKSQIRTEVVSPVGDDSQIIFTTSDGSTNNIDRVAFRKNGDLDILNGNLVIGTAGKGIDFSATSGTGTSELFDDYEEGTWTPTDASGAGLSFTSPVGVYTKVGRMVMATGYVQYPVTGNTNNTKIGGLPFSSISGNAGGSGSINYKQTSNIDTLNIDPSATTFSFFTATGSGTDNNQVSNQVVYFGLIYTTS